MHDKGTMKVIVFACIVIVFAVLTTGSISYFITRDEIVDKLKSRDMVYIISSIAAKIDGRLERAQEAALILAEDPAVIAWVSGAETDEQLGRYAKEKITLMARNRDYSNAFIVSAVTGNYWSEGARKIDVMSATDPDDAWFFNAIHSGKPVEVNIDSNKELGDTFVFINALMGDRRRPLAVVGVGLNLKDIAKEFQGYKIGKESNLWLVDEQGKIHLSEDIDHMGLYLSTVIPRDLSLKIVSDTGSLSSGAVVVTEYVNSQGEIMDLVYVPTRSTGWRLIFQMPRKESTALLDNIRFNTLVATAVALILTIFIFYFISDRIANPLKRAVQLQQEMEKLVAERTLELEQNSRKIMDSIAYARRLQESILPSAEELGRVFADFFVIWKPRDWVGGDFYWIRELQGGRVLTAVVDCTGHGVPGAFMTMAVNSILDHIVSQGQYDPARILAELNRRVKETLHRSDVGYVTDDGLDMGICCLEKNRLLFAGAKIPLYVNRNGQVTVIAADRKSIGYRRSNPEWEFNNTEWMMEEGDLYFMTTDGFVDQNGGLKDFPMGRRKFVEAIAGSRGQSMVQYKDDLEQVLAAYMGEEAQRDDITVLGFRFLPEVTSHG